MSTNHAAHIENPQLIRRERRHASGLIREIGYQTAPDAGERSSITIFLLDVAAARAQVAAAVQRLAARHREVERVVLFGSLARGDAVPGSDADLLVVLSHTDLPFLDRIRHYTPTGAGIGVDVFPYTREEWETKRAAAPHWAQEIASGITLYQRKHADRCRGAARGKAQSRGRQAGRAAARKPASQDVRDASEDGQT